MTRCILGIDAGTTHLKCALMDLDGGVRAVEKTATPICTGADGSWYDPQQIYGTVVDLIRRLAAGNGVVSEAGPAGAGVVSEAGPAGAGAVREAGLAGAGVVSEAGLAGAGVVSEAGLAGAGVVSEAGPAGAGSLRICGICITGMSEAGLVLERDTGRELTEILPWFDRRTKALAERTGPEEARQRFMKTGLYNSFKYGIYKYLWLLEERGLGRESTIWLSMCDYLAFRLTGRYATTAGFAVRTYAYDMEAGCWDTEYLNRHGLTERQFPQVIKEGASIGSCTDRELTGILGENVKAAIGGHDHICALYAMTGGDKQRIVDSSGTAETYMGLVDRRSLTAEDYANGVVYGPYPGGDKWFWMGNLPSSGQSVEWFRRELREEIISYEEMENMLEQQAGSPTGILYFPFMNGVGTPVYRADVQACFVQLGESNGTGEILKAVIEGVQYQGSWILECAPGNGEIQGMELWCAGGAAASREWMQIKADVLGLPVRIPAQEEATLLGAAAVFILENGSEQEQREFLKPLGRVRAVYLPKDGNRERYRILAEEYRRRASRMCGGL